MHTTMVPVQVKTMKIQAGVQVSRPGELRRHLQLWKRFGRHYLSIFEIDKVNHAMETNMVKLVVEIESFGMSADELDKETGSSDGLQPRQADLSCVHALNEPHLHEIHVLPSKHEADQC
ncbi:hypothetical protein Tco_1564794 [Tanacetum coccineum]